MFGLPHKAANGVGGAGEQAWLTSRILANEPGAAHKTLRWQHWLHRFKFLKYSKIIKSCNECPGRESLFAPFVPQTSANWRKSSKLSMALIRLVVKDQPFVALLLLLPWGARDLRPKDRHFEGGGMRFCFQHCSLVFSSGPSLAMMLLLGSLNHWNPTFFPSVYLPTQGLPDRSSFWTCNRKSLQDRMSMKS